MIKALIVTLGLVATLAPLAASADEITARADREFAGINRAVGAGRIAPWQAQRLDAQLSRLEADRRLDRDRQGGRLTRWQFDAFNATETRIAHEARFDDIHDRFGWR